MAKSRFPQISLVFVPFLSVFAHFDADLPVLAGKAQLRRGQKYPLRGRLV
jgi:hypothetical protein